MRPRVKMRVGLGPECIWGGVRLRVKVRVGVRLIVWSE